MVQAWTSLALGMAVAAGGAMAARAAVSGTCSHDGRTVAFIDGVAWLVPVEAAESLRPGAPAPPLRIGLSTFPVEPGDVARARDREDAFRAQGFGKNGAARIELTIRDGVVSQHYLWMSPGTNLSFASNEVGRFEPSPAAAGRAGGAYRFTPADGQALDCDLRFDLALLGDVADAPPLPGTPLPANGGAPGAAYLALVRALGSGDVDALVRLLPAERAAEMQAARNSPEFQAMMAFAKSMSPGEVRITGGRQDGDRAWVDFTAVEDGKPRVGVAEMKQEAGGRWIMLVESTRDPD